MTINEALSQLEQELNNLATQNSHRDVFTCTMDKYPYLKIIQVTDRGYASFSDTFTINLQTMKPETTPYLKYIQRYFHIIKKYQFLLKP